MNTVLRIDSAITEPNAPFNFNLNIIFLVKQDIQHFILPGSWFVPYKPLWLRKNGLKAPNCIHLSHNSASASPKKPQISAPTYGLKPLNFKFYI